MRRMASDRSSMRIMKIIRIVVIIAALASTDEGAAFCISSGCEAFSRSSRRSGTMSAIAQRHKKKENCIRNTIESSNERSCPAGKKKASWKMTSSGLFSMSDFYNDAAMSSASKFHSIWGRGRNSTNTDSIISTALSASPCLEPSAANQYYYQDNTNDDHRVGDQEEQEPHARNRLQSMIDSIMNSYAGPRLLLAVIACIYGTNFPLGSILDHAMPAAQVCSWRFGLAAIALSPFARRLDPSLWSLAIIAGCFTSTGYITQSLALAWDTPPATVSFLGAAVVIWCPFLEFALDGKPSSWHDRPQTWLAAILCLLGVGILEMCGGDGNAAMNVNDIAVRSGDILALIQAVGFGTGLFLSERMIHQQPKQALPITAVLVATTALVSIIWWMFSQGIQLLTTIGFNPHMDIGILLHASFTLNTDPANMLLIVAILWTGLVSTSLNFGLEIFALGRVPSGEASVWLALEPLWAAVFGVLLLGEKFCWNDYVGGSLIISACLVNSMAPETLRSHLRINTIGNHTSLNNPTIREEFQFEEQNE